MVLRTGAWLSLRGAWFGVWGRGHAGGGGRRGRRSALRARAWGPAAAEAAAATGGGREGVGEPDRETTGPSGLGSGK